MSIRLEKLGIGTPLKLRDADPSLLRERLGVVVERMALELHGIPCQAIVLTNPANKTIIASRSFGRAVTTRCELEQAVSSHVERAAEKMRRQSLAASVLTVFVMTNPFKPQEPQHSASHAVRLPVATADTVRLLRAARHGVGKVWRDGYCYKKAGVMMMELTPAAIVQGDLWTAPDSSRSMALMRAVDGINADHGRATLRFAASGVEQGWKLRCDQRSARFTTEWQELLTVAN